MSNDVSTLNGLFKQRYADKEAQLVPDHVKLYNNVKFNTSKKLGASYNEPVVLSYESGFTYGGTTGSAFTLNAAKEMNMQNATIQSAELVLRSVVSMAALNRSATGDQAISKALDLMIANMLKSIYHRLEVQMFYGQSGIGVVEADPTDTNGSAVLIKDAEWAAGIWNGTVGAEIEIFTSNLATKRGIYVIQGYSLENKSITISEVDSSGSITGDLSDIDVNDVIFFKGACVAGSPATKNEFLGVHGISAERSSLFGISNSAEPLFQGSIVDVGTDATTNAAILSQDAVERGISAMVEKGLMEEQVSVYINPRHWDDLLAEQDAKRRHTSVSGKVQSGAREVEFFGQNGTIKVIASTFVKEGYAYIISEKDLKRIGAVEVTFNRPDGKDYFRHLENTHGMEARCMSDQALFTSRPAAICQLRYLKAE